MNFLLPARPPFNLSVVVNSHGWVQLAPFSRDKETDGFDYMLELSNGQVIDLRVRPAVANQVQVDTTAALTAAAQAELRQRVTWMLGLHQDLTPFYELARTEPKLTHVADEARGRILRSASLFEDAIKTLCTVNTSWAGTKRMVHGLVEGYGAEHPQAPGQRAFPTAARLAAASEQDLRANAKLGFRAPFVLGLAQAVAAGTVDLEALKESTAPTLEVRKQLLAIKGIGDYAAANLLMILGRYDFIPVDSWALKVVSKEWHDGQPISRAEVEAAFAQWGTWKGLVYWFWAYA
jgi:3-methyladenine DNA glycosylase/8-oxoguanine DNA glycosylase